MDDVGSILRDVWKRQGVDPNPDISFYQYALAQLRQSGKIIYPLPTKDGNYYLEVDGYYICYTQPLLWAPIANPAEVHEGMPPF